MLDDQDLPLGVVPDGCGRRGPYNDLIALVFDLAFVRFIIVKALYP